MSKNKTIMEIAKMPNTLVAKIKNLFKQTFRFLTILFVGSGTVILNSTDSDAATRTLNADSTVGSNGIKLDGSNVVLAAGDIVIMSSHALAMTSALDIGTNAMGATTATTGNFSYNDVETSTAVAVLLTSHTANDASDITITAAAASDQITVVTWTANLVTVGGVVTYKADTNTASLMTVNQIGVTYGGAGTNTVMDSTGNGTVLMKFNAANSQTITSNINATTAGEATLQLANSGSSKTITMTGSVGNTGSLLLLDIDNATTISGTSAASTVDVDAAITFTGQVTAAAVTIDAATTMTAGLAGGTTLTMGAADILTTSGDITATNILLTNAASSIVQAGADVTITGDLKATNTTDSGILTLTGAKTTFAGSIGKASTTNLLIMTVADGSRAVITETGNFIEHIDMAAGGEIEIQKTVTGGSVFSMDATLMTNADIAGTKILMPVNLIGGETLELFKTAADEAAMVVKMDAALTDSALIDYTASNSSGTYTVVATAKSAAVTASELGVEVGTASGFAQALISVTSDANVDDTAEDAFYNALVGEGGLSAAEDTKLANQVGAQMDAMGGSSAASKAMTSTVQGIVSNRMASLRSGDAYVSGMSAGNGMSANSGFIQAFGSETEQKSRKKSNVLISGYDADTTGMAIGFDGITDGGSVLGLSLSLSETAVKGFGSGKATNNVDSYTASIYADKVTDQGYVEGSLTVGHNENDVSRILNSAGLNRKYTANYDSQHASMKIGGGFPNEVTEGSFITPYASVTGTLVTSDTYTEVSSTVGDNLRMKVAQDDQTSIVGSVGIKAHSVTDYGTPMISFAINNEFGDDTINSVNTYTGGGTAFTTKTDIESMSGTLGLGYTFGSDRASFNVGYEAEANQDDYLSHYGTVKLVAKF